MSKDEFLFIVNKHKYQFRPVFIIGCGRSGTTILGETYQNIKTFVFLMKDVIYGTKHTLNSTFGHLK